MREGDRARVGSNAPEGGVRYLAERVANHLCEPNQRGGSDETALHGRTTSRRPIRRFAGFVPDACRPPKIGRSMSRSVAIRAGATAFSIATAAGSIPSRPASWRISPATGDLQHQERSGCSPTGWGRTISLRSHRRFRSPSARAENWSMPLPTPPASSFYKPETGSRVKEGSAAARPGI